MDPLPKYAEEVSVSNLDRLQRAQNSAACFFTTTNKQTHITSVPVSLHWMPVHLRTIFKILVLHYTLLYGASAQQYI